MVEQKIHRRSDTSASVHPESTPAMGDGAAFDYIDDKYHADSIYLMKGRLIKEFSINV